MSARSFQVILLLVIAATATLGQTRLAGSPPGATVRLDAIYWGGYTASIRVSNASLYHHTAIVQANRHIDYIYYRHLSTLFSVTGLSRWSLTALASPRWIYGRQNSVNKLTRKPGCFAIYHIIKYYRWQLC